MARLNSNSLAGVTVVFAGVHTAHPEFADKKLPEIKLLISDCGGSHAAKVNNECTHLIATPEQYSRNGAKIKEAANYPDIKIVDFEWLSESLTSSTMVAEDGHLLDPSHGNISNAGGSDSGNGSALNLPNVAAAVTTTRATNGRKHQRSDDDDDTVDSTAIGGKKAKIWKKDGQRAKSRSVVIPVDEYFPSDGRFGRYGVYVDDQQMIYDATLNQTNTGNNNNKFYRIQVIGDGHGYITWTRWGRVGDRGQTKTLGGPTLTSAVDEFRKKFKEKSGHPWENRHAKPKAGKYTFLEMSYDDSSNEDDDAPAVAGQRRASKETIGGTQSKEVESKLPIPVQRLMRLIFNQQYFDDVLASLEYDTEKMPLGKMSKRTLLAGYEVLKELANLIQNNTSVIPGTNLVEAIQDRSNAYWSLIPHVFGRRRPPVLRDHAMIKKEIGLLEALTDMQLGADIMKAAQGGKEKSGEQVNLIDRQFRELRMQEMTPLDTESEEFVEVQEYLLKTAGGTHGITYNVQDVFRIERDGENDRFLQSEFSKIANSDRRLLWHGSRSTNFGGILSQGLRIAPSEAPSTGYMYGKGIYLADISTKSANYCASYSSGGVGLLLLCEAELGKPPLKLTSADFEAGNKAKEQGCLSTWGVGGVAPHGWKDAGCVHDNLKGVLMPDVSQVVGPSGEDDACLEYNEYIVYDVAQVRLRYLLRVEIK